VGLGETFATTKLSSPGFDRAIQYAAASRFYR
jgi:hypothetical protein